jgi:pyruvyl transferase EpsO
MVINVDATTLKKELHQALSKIKISNCENCALLMYPNHINLGDHLIWLGTIFYLSEILKVKISYAASSHDFSASVLEKQSGGGPIFLHGGGNLGDIWPSHQKFRERIIAKYPDRQIIIFPQSIYFAHQENLARAKTIFNFHPDLTLFVRDNYSYEIARENFYNCQVIKAPDMAFYLAEMPLLSVPGKSLNSILYLCREDSEFNHNFSPNSIQIPNLVVEDWSSFQRKWRLGNPNSAAVQFVAKLYRQIWQRGLATPGEWLSRQVWQNSHSWVHQIDSFYNPPLHYLSLSFLHAAIYQLQQYRLVITNRLHAHILCTLLGIPHIFLPNTNYKNEAFYQTWTQQLPFCRFVKDTTQIPDILAELID